MDGTALKALFLCYFAMFNPILIGTLSRVHLPHILPFYFPCKLKEMRYFRFMFCLYNVSSESCEKSNTTMR
jgi:hypothetical protein